MITAQRLNGGRSNRRTSKLFVAFSKQNYNRNTIPDLPANLLSDQYKVSEAHRYDRQCSWGDQRAWLANRRNLAKLAEITKTKTQLLCVRAASW